MLGLMGACCKCCESFKDYSFVSSHSNFLKMLFFINGEGYRYGGTDFFLHSNLGIPFFSYHPYRPFEYLSALSIVGSIARGFPYDISKIKYPTSSLHIGMFALLNLVCSVDKTVLNVFDKINNHFLNSLSLLKETCTQFSYDEMSYFNQDFVDYIRSFDHKYNYNFDIKFRIFYNPQTLYLTRIEMLQPSIATAEFTKI